MAAPLGHIKVLDLSRVLAGPMAGQMLADLGADVIKIERPSTGDDTRAWAPPYVIDPSDEDPGISAYFMCANRGKKSVAIDLADAQGAELVRRLAAGVDILIENFKVGGLAKYGLDYESVKATNPGIVYCSITGFGQTGPYAQRAGYDFLVQAMGGLMSITGQPDGSPGEGPLKVGVAIADQVSGLNALTGVLAALVRRERTGEGEHVDVALLDSTVAALANQSATYLATGDNPKRLGNEHPTVVPYQTFETADGHIIIGAGNDRQFASFCRVAGATALADDPRFATNAARVVNRAALIPEMQAIVKQRAGADWITELEAAGVPCGPINTVADVFADPQIAARQMRRTLQHPDAGPVDVVANPIRLASHDTTHPSPPPTLGADTHDVLSKSLGMSHDELLALAESGVITLGKRG